MFGYTNGADIDNIELTNLDITGNDYTGGLVGRTQSTPINNCSTTGSTSTSGNSYLGGLIGYNSSSQITNCYSSVNITLTGFGFDFGGLIGCNQGSTIEECHATGIINGNDNGAGGGLIGENTNSSLVDCYATGNVSGSNSMGGLVGTNKTTSNINRCYATGNVDGGNSTGGLAGENFSSSTINDCYARGDLISPGSSSGGLVGDNDNATIDNCYATGNVPVTGEYYGGLVGVLSGGSITDSFYDMVTTGQNDTGKGTPKTTAEMKDVDTFTDETTVGLSTAWDFETNPYDDSANNDYWDMDLSGTINSGYPFLAWQNGDDTALSYILQVKLKVFLQGPYDATGDSMSTALNESIPKTSPYTEDERTVSSIPADIIDWVLVELRSTVDGSAVVSRSAFLHKDGRIVADDGTTLYIEMSTSAGDYFIVIKHRNHLAVESDEAHTLSSGSSTLYDFTVDESTAYDKYYGGDASLLESSVYGMYAGDSNQSGIITNSDKDGIISDLNKAGYYEADTNCSGIITNSDKDTIITNLNKATSVN